MMKDEEVKDI